MSTQDCRLPRFLIPLFTSLALAGSFGCAGNKLTGEEGGSRGNSGKDDGKKPSASADEDEPDNFPDDTSPPGWGNDPDHVPVIDPDYPGLDVALVPEERPEGCQGSYDPEKREIELELNEETWGVRLSAQDGVLFANGRSCSDDEKKPLGVEQLERITVLGGDEDNVVILDLSEGEFGTELLQREAAFYFDVGKGNDHFLLRGSAEDDILHVGATTNRMAFALSKVARINVWLKNAEAFTVSTGPGNDKLEVITRLNVGLFDVDSGAVLRAGPVVVPMRAWGGAGDDFIVAGEKDDTLVGGEGDDQLNGGPGNDFFDEGEEMSGADIVNGGEGLDVLSYRFRTEGVRVTLCRAEAVLGCPAAECSCDSNNGEVDEGDLVVNFETVRSGSGDDTLVGSAEADFLYGEDGDDRLLGGDGSDVLQGGVGVDEFDGGEQADICDNDPGEQVSSCEI